MSSIQLLMLVTIPIASLEVGLVFLHYPSV